MEISGYLLPSGDVEGNQRIRFGSIDIGAVEYQSNITAITDNNNSFSSTIFPNPVTNASLSISVDKKSDFQLRLLKEESRKHQ